jgi:hypothetical protein
VSARLSPLKGELRTKIKRRWLVFARVHDRLPPDSAFASHGGWVLRYKTPFPEFQRTKYLPTQSNLRAWIGWSGEGMADGSRWQLVAPLPTARERLDGEGCGGRLTLAAGGSIPIFSRKVEGRRAWLTAPAGGWGLATPLPTSRKRLKGDGRG